MRIVSIVLIIIFFHLLKFVGHFTSLELDGGAWVSSLPPFKVADNYPIYEIFVKVIKKTLSET